jgi:predicted PurR-regulated permease PerM
MCMVVHLLSAVLIPFAFACLIAILLNPLSNRLQVKLPRGIAIFCSILIAIIVVSGLLYFLSTQILNFSETLPALKIKSHMILEHLQNWVHIHFGIATTKQMEMINSALHERESNIGQTLSSIFSGLAVLVLVPIYVFFLLFYKPLILDFLFQVFLEKHSLRVAEILGETKTAIQRYVLGLLTEMVIVSALNSIALLALGVRSAILIGVIGGILNTIPYLGGIVAIALPMMMATVTRDGYTVQLAILVSYLVIQLIDNNILVPKIVSSKVQINALFSILAVLSGGLISGYSGMFLAIPCIAILKIIFDRIDGLKPWGHLLGTTIPEVHAGVKWQARWQLIFIRKKQRAAEFRIEEKNHHKDES